MSGPDRYRIRTLVVEADGQPPAIDFTTAEEWRVLVTVAGTACAYIVIPSPGAAAGPGLVEAAVNAHGRERLAERALQARLQHRLGPAPARLPLRCSVVVCTHRRPQFLAGALESLQRLDPPPHEVVVVDNDPGPLDCRAEAEAAGVRYVREDRRGLSWARRAGMAAADGDVVAFTDDDCLVSPTWLRNAPALFADATVGAVTGPGFAYELETPGQLKRDETAGLIDRLRPFSFDWTNQRPLQSGAVGMGANMMFRRELPGTDLFAPELGAGTATQGAEDLHAIYKVLAGGYRVAYDPGAYLLHRHPRDVESVYETMHAWGVGFTAFLAKALVEDRELSGVVLWSWHWKMLGRAVLNLASGTGTPVEVGLRWTCFRAGLGGPMAWRRALREAHDRDARARRDGQVTAATAKRPPQQQQAAPAAGHVPPSDTPVLSVVVSAAEDARLERCLAALAGQEPAGVPWEVVVAAPDGVRLPAAEGLRALAGVSAVDAPAAGPAAANAGAAAARGDLLLFLDDALVPSPRLLAAHVGRHGSEAGSRLVIGHSPPDPGGRGLAAHMERMRAEDRSRLARESAAPTFVHVPPSNLSMARSAFERVGPLLPELGPRAGWEWGIRALQAGLEISHEPAAEARLTPVAGVGEVLERARAQGGADALLLARHPLAGPSLPAGLAPGGPANRAAVALLMAPAVRRWVVAALAALEALRFRRTWARVAALARSGAYAQGFRERGGRRRRALDSGSVLRVELASEAPIPPPAVAAPRIELTLHGRPLARISAPGGHWHHAIARRAVARLGTAGLLDLGHPGQNTPNPSLAGTAIVFGPWRNPGASLHRDEFEAAGATVVAAGERRTAAETWRAVDQAIRHCDTGVVALPLPGVVAEPRWLAATLVALEGENVAAVIGSGLRPGEPPSPMALLSQKLRNAPYAPGGRPPQYLVVRRALYEEVGGLDPRVAELGAHAALLDFVERVLEAGLVVAYRETPGLTPAATHRPARSRWEWSRWRARGALIVRRSLGIGGLHGAAWLATRGVLPMARTGWSMVRFGEPSLRHWGGSSAAFATGAVTAAIRLLRRLG